MRLLLVEDNASLAELLAAQLSREDFTVDRAATLAAADDALAVATYDAIILDLSLPDGDGLDLLKTVRAGGNHVPVLVLTARDRIEDRIRGLNLGADDYLPKPFDPGELLARLRALLRRPAAVVPSRHTIGNLTVDEIGLEAEIAGKRLELPPRERALLRLLARRAGKLVAKAAIEEALFGFDSEAGPNAIEVYIHRLRKRLQDGGATATIRTERGIGYLLAADEPPP